MRWTPCGRTTERVCRATAKPPSEQDLFFFFLACRVPSAVPTKCTIPPLPLRIAGVSLLAAAFDVCPILSFVLKDTETVKKNIISPLVFVSLLGTLDTEKKHS